MFIPCTCSFINAFRVCLFFFCSLLAGGADGYIVIYDLNSLPGLERFTYPSVATVALNNKYRHKFSVETVNWYPLDTGLFTSSGTDCLLKVWDTNRLKVYMGLPLIKCIHPYYLNIQILS